MREMLQRDYAWTPRQREVLTLISKGKTNPEIADALGISRDGVKYHVSEVLSKLGSNSREEAAEYWRRYNGLAPRFSRVFHGVAASTVLRWATATAFAGGVALAAGAVLLNRGGDEEPSSAVLSGTQDATPGIAGQDSTGDPQLDAVIAAVTSGDRALMESFLRLDDVACGEAGGPGNNLPCGNDPPGTVRPAFAHASCDGPYWTGSQFPWIDSFQSREPRVYAAYRQAPAPAAAPMSAPRGSAVVVFETAQNGGFAIEAEDGRIVAERATCGPFPYSLLERVPAADYILLPAGGIPVATPTPAPQLTGDAATDAIIRAIVDGDWQTISDKFERRPLACTAQPTGVGSPPKCPPGVPEGGNVPIARVMACEWAYLSTVADFQQILEPRFRFPHRLHAVYRTYGALRFDYVPTGELAIVTAEGDAAQTWFVEDGQLVGALLGCGETAAKAVEGVEGSAFLISPSP
jgi:DNA-binding CsgD family transcriptional regulator